MSPECPIWPNMAPWEPTLILFEPVVALLKVKNHIKLWVVGTYHSVYLNLTESEYLFLCVLSTSSPVDLVWSCWSAIDPLPMICSTADLLIQLVVILPPPPVIVTHTVLVSFPIPHLMMTGKNLESIHSPTQFPQLLLPESTGLGGNLTRG